nr:uracil-DNA glycosylase [uncultured Veillonella sp.]
MESKMNIINGMSIRSARDFVNALSLYEGNERVFNPWRDYDERYDVPQAAQIRQAQLAAYLEPRLGTAPYVVVAEAVGYQGGRFTGIAITCERMLLGHHKTIKPHMILKAVGPDLKGLGTGEQGILGSSKEVGKLGGAGEVGAQWTSRSDSPYIEKTTQKQLGFNEPTDTVVWNSIVENGLDPYKVLLWNIFPFHPHKVQESLSNRTPTPDELDAGWAYTKALLALNGEAKVFAVGQKAAQTLAHYGVEAVALRHPANGGANLYKMQFKEALK